MVQKQNLVFLVRKEESRDFDVFLGFFVFGREGKRREELGKEKISKEMCVPLGLMGVWGYF